MFEKIVRWFNWDSFGNWCAGAGGMILGLAGGWDALMKVLVVCMAVDYATGVINAIRERKLSSKVGFVGILRKLTIFGVVIVAAQVDAAIKQDRLKPSEGMRLLAEYERGLKDQTYLSW